MGRNSRSKLSSLPFENDSRCMRNIVQMHHWRPVKKMLPHKRHANGSQFMGTGFPEIEANTIDSNRIELEDTENDSIIEEQKARAGPTTKSLVKTRTKAQISEEKSKKKSRTHSELERTLSIHHLKPSNQNHLPEIIPVQIHTPPNLDQDIEFPSQRETKFTEFTEKTSGPHNQMNDRSGYQATIMRFRNLKRNIKHAISENRKEKHRIIMDAVFHKVQYGQSSGNGVDITNTSESTYPSKPKARHMGRASSLKESLHKYSQLFEFSFNREAETSNSEKLRLKEEASFGRNSRKHLGRILSLPDIKTQFNIRSEDSCDSFLSGIPIGTRIGSTPNEQKIHLLPSVDNEDQDLVASREEQEFSFTSNLSETVLDCEFQTPCKQLVNDFLHVSVNAGEEAEFTYVKDVLELSGFSGTEILGKWQSADQPLDPLMYDELEGPEEKERSEYSNNHLVLYDLINESLMEIYERSFGYCPLLLSSCSHIRTMPVGHRVLEEVWSIVSRHLRLRSECVSNEDFFKEDVWMDLRFDIECIGLQIEDLIFDDLIVEALLT